ncbi:DegV family protein [Clostridium ganghwense]|uniref:DegV family protein n=1 Tax=Clostridium ganghwense TaxID=312089 RepID=A0ABT4CJ23_9CLOT|nr:DegV family protein [Clostridium ganghwense]MCY6369050.1 DegV family protein [Clostridium ganghwense]
MKNFVIITDSCCDLPIEIIEEKQIPFVSLTYSYYEEEYKDDLGKSMTPNKFFDDMRNGAMPKTSQPSSQAFYEAFKEIVSSGRDIIYICVSTGLSGTLNSSNIAKNMIKEEFPQARVHIVDILTASLGQGLMVLKAYEMQENGSSYEEIVDYLEMNKQKLNTYMTVDDLGHLKRGGRISAAAATIGMVLHIKPLLTLNHEGRVMPVVKIRGRKKVIKKLAQIVKERIENSEEQIIAISHGDCIDEAFKLKEYILEEVKVKDVLLNYIGPAVGTFGGPGALAVFFMGRERQHHIIEN